jgi:hypothetical protein
VFLIQYPNEEWLKALTEFRRSLKGTSHEYQRLEASSHASYR